MVASPTPQGSRITTPQVVPSGARPGERDAWIRHVGLAALVGFAVGLLAVMVTLALQWWLGRWVMTFLVAGLVLLLLPAWIARGLVRYLFSVEEQEERRTWLDRVGEWWLRTWLGVDTRRSEGARGDRAEEARAFESAAKGRPDLWPAALGLRLSRRTVREIMVPRPDIVGIPADATAEQAAQKVVESGYSRLPMFRGDLDVTEGVIHAKDVLALLVRGQGSEAAQRVARPVQFVPESKPLSELLTEMRQGRFHLAMVSDEYGSVVGLVTLEDVIEELVGQIADEFDREPPEIERLPDGTLRVQAAVPIVDLNEVLGASLPHASWNTVGGLVFGLAGKIPEPGTSVELEGFRFTVERVQGRRIVSVLVTPPAPAGAN